MWEREKAKAEGVERANHVDGYLGVELSGPWGQQVQKLCRRRQELGFYSRERRNQWGFEQMSELLQLMVDKTWGGQLKGCAFHFSI